MSTILAIDPGPTESAYVLWEHDRVRPAYSGKSDNLTVLEWVIPSQSSPGRDCAIEMIASYGMPVGREVFDTCVWIGRFYEAWHSRRGNNEPVLIYRLAVKQHLCHDSRAKDGNIRQALIDRLGAPGTKKHPGGTYGISGDMWAALAVAVTASDESVIGCKG